MMLFKERRLGLTSRFCSMAWCLFVRQIACRPQSTAFAFKVPARQPSMEKAARHRCKQRSLLQIRPSAPAPSFHQRRRLSAVGKVSGSAAEPPPVIFRGGRLFDESGDFNSEAAEIFLKTYWQKHPVLFRSAMPFESPITPDELAGLVSLSWSARIHTHDTHTHEGRLHACLRWN